MTDLQVSRPAGVDERVQDLLARMTLEEKLAQIVGFWEKSDGEAVAPLQGEFTREQTLDDASRHGLGHLTRVYGTRPVDPAARARWLWSFQRRLVRETRLGSPRSCTRSASRGSPRGGPRRSRRRSRGVRRSTRSS